MPELAVFSGKLPLLQPLLITWVQLRTVPYLSLVLSLTALDDDMLLWTHSSVFKDLVIGSYIDKHGRHHL